MTARNDASQSPLDRRRRVRGAGLGVVPLVCLLIVVPGRGQAVQDMAEPDESGPRVEAADVPHAPAPSSLAARLAALDHPAWEVRREATEALMKDRRTGLDALLAAAADLPPSLERDVRLESVVLHRLVSEMVTEVAQPGDQASLGITHPGKRLDALPNREGVEIVVMDTLPGFPAHAVLRPGDVLVSVNGRAIPSAEDPDEAPPIKDLLQALRAGDTVPLGVVRDGRELRLTVTLASSRALNQIYTPPPATLRVNHAQQLETNWRELRQRAGIDHRTDESATPAPPTQTEPAAAPDPAATSE